MNWCYTCWNCEAESTPAKTSDEADVNAFKEGWCIGHHDGQGHYVCPDCKDAVFDAVPLRPLWMSREEAEALLATNKQ